MGVKHGCPVGTMMATTVTVYASSDSVNVIIPGTGGPSGEGNHVYKRPRGAVSTWIKDLIASTIRFEPSLKWAERGYEIGTPVMETERGKYTVRVYCYRFPMRVISGAGHRFHGWNFYRNDGRKLSFTWAHHQPHAISVREYVDNEWRHYTSIVLNGTDGKPLSESVWIAEEAVDRWIENYGERV